MTTKQATAAQLKREAELNGLSYRFNYNPTSRDWTATHRNGRVLWTGSLADMRNIAKGSTRS
jgi:hypothetical protein